MRTDDLPVIFLTLPGAVRCITNGILYFQKNTSDNIKGRARYHSELFTIRPKQNDICVYGHMLKKIRVGRSGIFFFNFIFYN